MPSHPTTMKKKKRKDEKITKIECTKIERG
jgi:hypothetical protein